MGLQVEQRLRFYDTGETCKKNVDAMKEVIDELRAEGGEVTKKRKSDGEVRCAWPKAGTARKNAPTHLASAPQGSEKKKKKKKDKEAAEDEAGKKKKKKKKDKE